MKKKYIGRVDEWMKGITEEERGQGTEEFR